MDDQKPINKKELTDSVRNTHSILNYLNAGLQGKFAFYNILSQLEHPLLDKHAADATRDKLKQVGEWLNDLWDDYPMYTSRWEIMNEVKGKKPLVLLEEYRDDINALVPAMFQALAIEDLTQSPENVKFLIACFGRFAYSKDNYIRGFIDLGNNFNSPHTASTHSTQLEESEADIRLTHLLLKSFKESKQPGKMFYDSLSYAVLTLPGTFNTQIHDINQLLSSFLGEFSFELAGIPEEEAQEWEKFEVGPIEAGYWRAHGMTPKQAVKWNEAGFTNYTTASKWRAVGFDPESAAPWFYSSFPLPIAFLWASAGYSTEEAFKHIGSGIMDPEQVPEEEEIEETPQGDEPLAQTKEVEETPEES